VSAVALVPLAPPVLVVLVVDRGAEAGAEVEAEAEAEAEAGRRVDTIVGNTVAAVEAGLHDAVGLVLMVLVAQDRTRMR